jgi:arabinose-5-phosphate isomerase
VLEIESKAISDLVGRVGADFCKAVEAILSSSGRVVVSGVGKSGIVGRKIAATLASTGTPSFFLHPGDAYHGDLGMVTSTDIFLAISNSGGTEELVRLFPFLSDNGNFVISLTGNPQSRIANCAHLNLDASVSAEACPLQLAPTASTSAALALGDALAIALMEARGFKSEHFARLHPGGSIGRRLLRTVDDEMITSDLPVVQADTPAVEVLRAMSRGELGIAIVEIGPGLGIVTDGDVRRSIEKYGDGLFSVRARDLATAQPLSVPSGTRIDDALNLMGQRRVSCLLILGSRSELLGIFRK